jgi:hypothetical protein
MSGVPIPDGAYVPTPDEIESARYLVGWADGRLARDLLHDYAQRVPRLSDDHLVHALAREGFFTGTTPIVDVGCGPSPHVGYHLNAHIEDRDLSFLDTNPSALQVHRATYQQIQQEERWREHGVRAQWLLGDALDEPYLLSHKAVLVHGALPVLNPATHTRVRYDAPEMTRLSLESLLSALPARLALYLDAEHDLDCPAHPAHVRAALDQLGATYRVVESVASANFTPREGGYLVLLTP